MLASYNCKFLCQDIQQTLTPCVFFGKVGSHSLTEA